ncbi:murein DD-endopeptidase MepM/ murein hydrolase activator NlpD [Sphingomonas kaistensis]|uniref:Murein DD-endopeptidase MepM/ murein hydrolase activator NlpD n=1 Tax=Sphingomonas kaistensis TaxID=298708 RepID=A0A7X6BF25_9SPHN|nr:M23 family metallopeptidase [Sphingomonas kaistensis]NJC04929.1 murein DD-endopeptidase MepM/ murein hydrolase activator NlpD [Sphingomonas kaistensis]
MFQSPRPLVAAAALPTFGRAAALRPPQPRFSLVVDLTQNPFSRHWWRGAATLAALVAGVAQLAPPLTALPSGVAIAEGPDQARQEQALAVGALAYGSSTGLPMSEGPRARPIAAAPARQLRALSLIVSPGDELSRLLQRNGARASDALQAAALARAEKALPTPGTTLTVRLGAPDAAGSRGIDYLQYRARLDLELVISGSDGGGLSAERRQLGLDRTPLRLRGSVGGGLYWALRSAGASPAQAADYLGAIGASLDVGSEVMPGDRFELVVAQAKSADGRTVTGDLLYAGLDRGAGSDLSLVRVPLRGRLQWISETASPEPVQSGLLTPVAGPITSGFGGRMHPILRFIRMHNGVDYGAGWGSPIVAAADGQVVRAGWAGGYGRQVRIAHEGGLVTSYSHMSRIVAGEGGVVRRGELIGYVGSSGLSTGPHLHYEVLRNGTPVNPLGVTLVSRPVFDEGLMAAVRARAKALRGL